MCGRYAFKSPVEHVRQLFRFKNLPNLPPRYNIAPTQDIAVIRDTAEGGRELTLMRWGLVPFWIKDMPKTALINARVEGIDRKPSFRAAVRARRCLIPADGWYEWRQEGARKQPYFLHRKDMSPLAFAGIWETWQGPDGAPLLSAALITRPAAGRLAEIHDRMPAVLAPEEADRWLADETNTAIESLTLPGPGDFTFYACNPIVGNPRNDTPACLEPLAGK